MKVVITKRQILNKMIFLIIIILKWMDLLFKIKKYLNKREFKNKIRVRRIFFINL